VKRGPKKLCSILLERQAAGALVPRIVHVETRSRCNGRCEFCPAAVANDPRDDVLMPEDMIDSVIDQLAAIAYANRLSFYNNNEPFLDDRMPDIIGRARNRLPLAYLELKSNGKTLDLAKVLSVFDAGLDVLYVNDYTTDARHSAPVEKLRRDLAGIRRFKGHFDSGHYCRRVIVTRRDTGTVMGSRAGTSPNRDPLPRPLTTPCCRPCEMMTISPGGDVSVCSEDFLFAIKMGNIAESGLMDLWRSQPWQDMREALLRGQRDINRTCAKCDYRGYTSEMLREYDLTPETTRPGRTSLKHRIIDILRTVTGKPKHRS